MKTVLGIGNALVDIMTQIEHDDFLNASSLPKGSMQLIDEKSRELLLSNSAHFQNKQASGGCASNTVHGLSELGIQTGFIGKVGQDELGEFFVNDMRHAGIQPHLTRSNINTGTALAFVSPDGERTFATYLGAAVEMTPADLDPKLFENYDLFHIEGYLVQNQGLIAEAVELAKKKGMKVSLDLASYNVVEDNFDFLKDIVNSHVDIVFANEEESKAFSGSDDPHEALEQIGSQCDIAVVKLGKDGSLISHKDNKHSAPSIDVNVVDTTGAGDLYASGFLYGLIEGYPLDQCAKIGAIVAGNVIGQIGAKMDKNQWQDIRSSIGKI